VVKVGLVRVLAEVVLEHVAPVETGLAQVKAEQIAKQLKREEFEAGSEGLARHSTGRQNLSSTVATDRQLPQVHRNDVRALLVMMVVMYW
jgi:hypothetical protein